MKKSGVKLFVILCGFLLISIPLFSIASCAKKKPPAPVVEEPAKAEEMKRVEDEAKRKAEEAAKKKAEEEARMRAEEAAKKKAEEEKAKAEAEEAAEAAEEAKAEAAEAAEEAKAEAAEAEAGKVSHEVVKGESLWKIAKYNDVYENPFMWPLIYKANHDKIKDPDLIYPKQVFSIPRDYSSKDESKAVHHAKTRGEWSLHDGSEKYWEPGYKKE